MRRQHIELIKRMDQLIRLRATGNYKQFARRLGISNATLYRLLDVLKYDLEAPIRYNYLNESYEYEKNGSIEIRFIPKNMIDSNGANLQTGTKM